MIIYSLQERNDLALIKWINEAKNLNTESFKEHMVACIVLEQNIEELWFLKYGKYFPFIIRLLIPEPFNCHNL